MIPSTMDLRGCFSGPPPVLGAGSRGSISAHCSPVKSEGYRRCRDTRPRTRVKEPPPRTPATASAKRPGGELTLKAQRERAG